MISFDGKAKGEIPLIIFQYILLKKFFEILTKWHYSIINENASVVKANDIIVAANDLIVETMN